MNIVQALQNPDTWMLFLAMLAVSAGWFTVGVVIGWTRGVARGRELQSMEPPSKGRMHFRDGGVVQVPATDASTALDRFIRDSARRRSLVGPATPWRRD